MIYKVIENYKSQYNDPIHIEFGTLLNIEKEDSEYPGWFFCRIKNHSQHKGGWVPKSVIAFTSQAQGYAIEEYTAKELDILAGEIIEKIKEINGWIWCKKINNCEEGWIPSDIISEV